MFMSEHFLITVNTIISKFYAYVLPIIFDPFPGVFVFLFIPSFGSNVLDIPSCAARTSLIV
jgi:hypothetical protein